MPLRETLSNYWQKFQAELFPFLEEAFGPLTPSQQQLVVVLDLLQPEKLLPHWHGAPGRPASERAALARAFVAKAGLNLATTAMLIERVQVDKTLRRLCRRRQVSRRAGQTGRKCQARRHFPVPLPNLPPANCRRGCMRRWSGKPMASGWSGILPAIPPP